MMKTNTVTISNAYLAESEENQSFDDQDLYYEVTRGLKIINPDFIPPSPTVNNDVETAKKCLPKQHNMKVFDGKTIETLSGEQMSNILQEFDQEINEFFSVADFESDDSEEEDGDRSKQIKESQS